MNERATRFARACGSEEVEVADLCEPEDREDNENEDDIEYQSGIQYRSASTQSKSGKSRNSIHVSANRTSVTDVTKASSRLKPNFQPEITTTPSSTYIDSNYFIVQLYFL